MNQWYSPIVDTPRFFASAGRVPRGTRQVDAFSGALEELFFINHPDIAKKSPEARGRVQAFIASSREKPVYAYYPWRQIAVRMPGEKTYYRLRTARNRELITEREQAAYRKAAVGIAGLSVGSAAAAALVATGGPKKLKLADPDIVEVTNLNRMRAALPDVGKNKAVVAAHAAWEIDPFADIEVWDAGIRLSDARKFLSGLDVFVDEMDDIGMKVEIRKACRNAKIPVIMATDNGDSIIVDIERFDEEPSRALFHGRIALPDGDLSNLTRESFVALANQIIDPLLFTDRQRDSIAAIGTRLAGVAQIATAATLAGAAVAYAVRQIVTGGILPSGRYVMGCEPTFTPGYLSGKAKAARAAHARKFMRAMRLRPAA